MTKMNRIAVITLILCSLGGCKKEAPVENQKMETSTKEVLLMGTFHYNNPGADVAKTKSFDILSKQSQLELELIASKIKEYNPSKIFVEWPYDEQPQLDSLYQLYQDGNYFINDSLSNFYLKNEIFQLAFRVAKKNNLEKIYAMDYNKTAFPYQEVMNDIEANQQIALKEKLEQTIAKFTNDFDNMIDSGASLTELTLALNTEEMNYTSNDLHNNLFSMAGGVDDFNGVFLTSEWYKRNLYMWTLIQKNTDESDKRIMVLAGSGHTAMMELFIKGNRDWSIKKFKDVVLP